MFWNHLLQNLNRCIVKSDSSFKRRPLHSSRTGVNIFWKLTCVDWEAWKKEPFLFMKQNSLIYNTIGTILMGWLSLQLRTATVKFWSLACKWDISYSFRLLSLSWDISSFPTSNPGTISGKGTPKFNVGIHGVDSFFSIFFIN